MQRANEVDKTRLTEGKWERIFAKLRTIEGIYTGIPSRCRRFVEAVLWALRVGGQWRALPPERGNWNSAFKRFARWSMLGIWGQLHEWLAEEADLQEVSIDSTIARAHACAAGAAKSCADNEALGRSRGGFGCKIHAVVNALGLPVKFILTGGQAADITEAIPPMANLTAPCLADKSYDSDVFLAWLKESASRPSFLRRPTGRSRETATGGSIWNATSWNACSAN